MLDKYYEKYNINYCELILPKYNDNKDKITFAIYLMQNDIIPPKEWLYEPEYKFNKDNTTAMKLA